MTCLQCPRASDCHNEKTKHRRDLKEGLEFLKKGYLMQAIETLELLHIRMEKHDSALIERS